MEELKKELVLMYQKQKNKKVEVIEQNNKKFVEVDFTNWLILKIKNIQVELTLEKFYGT